MAPAPTFSPAATLFLLFSLPLYTAAAAGSRSCRSYCGNITVDYPFGVRDGCGHPVFRQLLFCINGVLLLHVPSGSYRVLTVDYAFRRLTLHDASMSDCYSLAPSSPGHGFVAEPWRSPFLGPASDNVFFLLGCRHDSPVFQLGFPVGRGVCRSVSGMSCRDYYRCPAWDVGDSRKPWPWARGADSSYGAASSPPECCSVPAGAVRELNLTQLRCAAYSSAYSLAPLRPPGAGAWSYGIRIAYSLPTEHEAECRGCQFSGGTCGYDASNLTADDDGNNGGALAHLCLCGGGGGDGGIDAWNSTSTCDSTGSSGQALAIKGASIFRSILGGWLVYVSTWVLEF
ncbi:Wall-associated receptor kinase 3 [Platanthera zijinensis]|uniref:Wall-associated receptor kinase 3 n=1 Tax=Platanthera zijinensis TaxID=2320716 RepID=A0AAP0BQR4_9ASPA